MEAPPKLDPTLPGGESLFDPLGFSSMFDLTFLREAEIKHGRICMLATLGWIFPEFYHLPAPAYTATNPLEAVTAVGFLPIAQIVLLIVVCEALSYKKVYYEGIGEPGAYGWDPLGLLKDPKQAHFYKTAEIKNGRLAMIAIGGFIHHALITHQGTIAQLKAGNFTHGAYPF